MHDLSLVTAQTLALNLGGATVFSNLSFVVNPGLTWIRGGDGRGKTSLLRILAGQLEPTTGAVRRASQGFFADCALGVVHDNTVASQWLAGQQGLHALWDEAAAHALVADFGLQDHVHKPLFMLSAGSRRKLGLAAAVASGARLTLLDMPYAALDARSSMVLDRLIEVAATDCQRAWVVADCVAPARLPLAHLAAFVDLGD